jgi:hypothetical protein
MYVCCVAHRSPIETICVLHLGRAAHAAVEQPHGTALILIFILNSHHLEAAILNLVQSTRPVAAVSIKKPGATVFV